VLDATATERQRLHQELHDGLGPALSGIALGLEAAEVSLPRTPERSAALLAHLRQETQSASREVRRLVEGLRPAALDREDLDGALHRLVDGLQAATAGRLSLRLSVTGDLRGLGPEVDAAAYRIVAEAVTNVVRHSGAAQCDVDLSTDGERLVVTVEDDGTGLPQQPRPGVGLSSMRARARSLGGTWTARAREGGGTRVEVVLPCRAAVEGEAR
jgi:signal transduction histidine kinase